VFLWFVQPLQGANRMVDRARVSDYDNTSESVGSATAIRANTDRQRNERSSSINAGQLIFIFA